MSGTGSKPRLSVYKSLNNIYAQLIDDLTGKTLLAASSMEKEIRSAVKHGGNLEAAKKVGASIAQKALGKKITDVVFDRGGYRYHGCIKALADAAREQGLKF
jgi:large subunit ribosomal protein L18